MARKNQAQENTQQAAGETQELEQPIGDQAAGAAAEETSGDHVENQADGASDVKEPEAEAEV